MKKETLLLLLSFLLSACVGSIFGLAPQELEDLQHTRVRKANTEETKKLDRCLHKVFKKQQSYFSNKGKYINKIEALGVGKECRNLHLSLEVSHKSYLVTAKIITGKTMVKWTLNETGEAMEYSDPKMLDSF